MAVIVSRLSLFFLCAGLLTTTTPVHAQEAGKTLLLLGIQQQDKPNEAARRVVTTRLVDLGRVEDERGVLRVRPLGPKETGKKADPRSRTWQPKAETCKERDPGCLTWLAERERTTRILGGDITESKLSTERSTYTVHLWVYDSLTGKIAERTEECDECTRDGLSDTLRTVTGRLFDKGGEAASVQQPRKCPICPSCQTCPACPAVTPCPTVPAVETPAGLAMAKQRGLSPGRKAAAGIFGTLLFLSLGGAGTLAYMDGRQHDQMCSYDKTKNCMLTYTTQNYVALPLAGAALSTLGLILSLVPAEPK